MARGMASRDSVSGTFPIAVALTAVNAGAILWMALGFAFAGSLSAVLFGGTPGLLLDFLFSTVVTYGALRSFLSSGEVRGAAAMLPPGGVLPWNFILRSLVLAMPGVIAMMTVGGLLYPVASENTALIFGVAIGLVVQAATLALFGSMLVDIANGGEGDPERAMLRGRQAFVPVFAAFLAGPAVADLLLLTFDRAVSFSGAPGMAFEPGAAHVNPLGLVIDIASHLGRAFVALLTAVVLGRAWMRTIPSPR